MSLKALPGQAGGRTATSRPPSTIVLRNIAAGLGVGPRQVVQLVEASDGRLVAEGAVWAAMVVGPEPAVKGGGAFAAGAVERAVGPAAQHGADEALGFAVGAGPVGPGAQVAQAHHAASDRVDGGAVGRAVVGHHPLDVDAVAAVERERALEERDRGGGLLIGEHLDVGQAGSVVDADV